MLSGTLGSRNPLPCDPGTQEMREEQFPVKIEEKCSRVPQPSSCPLPLDPRPDVVDSGGCTISFVFLF